MKHFLRNSSRISQEVAVYVWINGNLKVCPYLKMFDFQSMLSTKAHFGCCLIISVKCLLFVEGFFRFYGDVSSVCGGQLYGSFGHD